MVITEPVPAVLEELGWTGGESITDMRTMVHYMRTTRDGRPSTGSSRSWQVAGSRPHGEARSTCPRRTSRWSEPSRAAMLRKEAAEERGEAPGRVSAFVAGIPEWLGIHIGR